MKTTAIFGIVAPLFLLSACASTPDPAEVCSAEWIKPRADRAMNDFKKDAGSTFKTMEKAASKLVKGDNIGPLQMFSIMSSLNRLGNTFENGRGMKDMRTLASTCNDPELIKSAMTNFMREQGISDRFITFLNGLREYQQLLETGKRPNLNL